MRSTIRRGTRWRSAPCCFTAVAGGPCGAASGGADEVVVRHAEGGVQLVDVTQRLEDAVSFGPALSIVQRGCPRIASLGVDLVPACAVTCEGACSGQEPAST